MTLHDRHETLYKIMNTFMKFEEVCGISARSPMPPFIPDSSLDFLQNSPPSPHKNYAGWVGACAAIQEFWGP